MSMTTKNFLQPQARAIDPNANPVKADSGSDVAETSMSKADAGPQGAEVIGSFSGAESNANTQGKF